MLKIICTCMYVMLRLRKKDQNVFWVSILIYYFKLSGFEKYMHVGNVKVKKDQIAHWVRNFKMLLYS